MCRGGNGDACRTCKSNCQERARGAVCRQILTGLMSNRSQLSSVPSAQAGRSSSFTSCAVLESVADTGEPALADRPPGPLEHHRAYLHGWPCLHAAWHGTARLGLEDCQHPPIRQNLGTGLARQSRTAACERPMPPAILQPQTFTTEKAGITRQPWRKGKRKKEEVAVTAGGF